ncbi:MAG: site-2 protease family protein [Verrucomicrobiae bacterium]|nr:site-2 protease family protein [Verrucomicrobiae bacterium]
MKWSFKVGRWWGVDVYVHATFLLLLAVVGLQGGSLIAAAGGVLLYGSLFGCVLLHEFGHALAARHYGIGTRDITLLPIGGVARLERIPDNPRHELVIAIAGPLVNVAIGGALAAFLILGQQSLLPRGPLDAIGLAQRLLLVNVSLVAFNLLPAFPMDGGRILRALLAMQMGPVRATRIAATVGKFMALVFAGVAIYFQMYLLLFIAVFVWLGAGGEARATEARTAMGGAVVGQAMLTRFHSVSVDDPLDQVANLIISDSQSEFPVMDGPAVAGVLSRTELLEALRRSGATAPARTAMRTDFITLQADEPLEPALGRLSESPVPMAPVMWQQRLVGLLTLENAGEFIAIRRARSSEDPRPPVISSPRADGRAV